MSRTIGGWTFRCKNCKKIHFYPSGNKPTSIILGCTENEYSFNEYNKKDFIQYYWGRVDRYIISAIVKELE